jgi:hypothetical protein
MGQSSLCICYTCILLCYGGIMSISKYNYEALCELYCYWFHKVYGVFPHNSDQNTRAQMVRKIWILKRVFKRMEKSNENVRNKTVHTS